MSEQYAGNREPSSERDVPCWIEDEKDQGYIEVYRNSDMVYGYVVGHPRIGYMAFRRPVEIEGEEEMGFQRLTLDDDKITKEQAKDALEKYVEKTILPFE